MAHELIYTSAERGLRPGTRGFCTVAHTRGMAPQMMQLLEALCAYKGIGAPSDGKVEEPVSWSHLTNSLLGRNTSIISRIGATSPDHTGRSNKLAHHVVLQGRERCACGPAWLCEQEGFFLEEWYGEPHLIESPKEISALGEQGLQAKNWEKITGDAGNAAILPELYLSNPDAVVLLVYNAGTDLLPLICESLVLLPESLRWRVTFNTYFSQLPAGSTCCWRGCISDSDAVRNVRRNPNTVMLDLTGSTSLKTPESEMAELARTGHHSQKQKLIVTPRKHEDEKSRFVLMDNRNINMLTMKPRGEAFNSNSKSN